MINFANFTAQPQVPLDPRLNAAPMVPEQPFVVGDYAKKKRIAEALRGKVGKGIESYDPLITTAANDYFPGQVQVNYAGILGNALNPWLEQGQEEKAAAAEEEASAARMEALNRLTGKETPQELIALGEQTGMQELTNAGITQMTTPPKDYTAQKMQYGGTAAGMRSINAVLPGTYTDEQIATQAAAEEAERQRVQQEKIAVKKAGVAPQAPNSKAQVLGGMYAKFAAMPDGPEKKAYGEQIRQMELMDDTTKTGGGGGVAFNPETGEWEATGTGGLPASLEKFYAAEEGKAMEARGILDEKQRSLARITDSFVANKPGMRDKLAAFGYSNDFNSLARMIESGEFNELTAMMIGEVTRDARALAPVSNTDIEYLARRFPNALNDPKQAVGYMRYLQEVTDRERGRTEVSAAYNGGVRAGLIPRSITALEYDNMVNNGPAGMSPEQKRAWKSLPVLERAREAQRSFARKE